MTSDETLFGDDGRVGHIVLNRPALLNALSHGQVGSIAARLSQWAAGGEVAVAVVAGGGGRAFCVGGDLKARWEARGDILANRAWFRDLYRLSRQVHHFPKPYIALLDGWVMGAGAGLSIAGRFRVASETTRFMVPEPGIGFFPDCGATFFLSRCPGRIGLYLALGGAQLGPADCLWAGLATHYVPQAARPALLTGLARAASAADPQAAVAEVLEEFSQDPGPSSLAEQQDAIDRCFAFLSPREIVSALVADGGEWAWEALEIVGDASPTALTVTHRQVVEGAGLDFDAAIRREYRIAMHMITGDEFFEGIRARVIDKDRRPDWRPATLAEVTDAAVARYFAPVEDGELDFG